MVHERGVYAREHAAGTYSPAPYLAAQALVELPWLAPQSLLYTVVLYPLLGLRATAAGFFFALLVALLSAVAMLLLSQALVHSLPQASLATLALSVLGGSLFSVLSGFMAPAPGLPPWWKWFYYVNPMAYNLYALTGAW